MGIEEVDSEPKALCLEAPLQDRGKSGELSLGNVKGVEVDLESLQNTAKVFGYIGRLTHSLLNMKFAKQLFGKSLVFLIILLLLIAVFYYVDFVVLKTNKIEGFYYNLLFEAHGLLFDIFVFGIVLSIYESHRSLKDRTKNALELIDVHKQLNSQISSVQCTQLLKELNGLGRYKFDLSRAHFVSGWILERLKFKKADFSSSVLKHIRIEDCSFSKCNFRRVQLEDTVFFNCSLKQCDFKYSNLNGVRFTNKSFSSNHHENIKILKAMMTKESGDWFTKNFDLIDSNRIQEIPTVRIQAKNGATDILVDTEFQARANWQDGLQSS